MGHGLTEEDRDLFQRVTLGFREEEVDDNELDNNPGDVYDKVFPAQILQTDRSRVLKDELDTIRGQLLQRQSRGSDVERIDLGDVGCEITVKAKANDQL